MIGLKCQKVFVFLSILLLVSCSSDDVSIAEPNPQDSKLVVGQKYKGGIIAYLFKPWDKGYVEGEEHGLIVTENDISAGAKWAPTYTGVYNTKLAIGQGLSNTELIVAKFGQDEYAAKLCYDLVLNGYEDWYLPSDSELLAIQKNRSNIGNMVGVYWSSTEWFFHDAYSGQTTWNKALTRDFNDYSLTSSEGFKTFTNKVRAVRAF